MAPEQTKAVWWETGGGTAHIEKGRSHSKQLNQELVTYLCGKNDVTYAIGRQSAGKKLGSNPMFYVPCKRCVSIAAKNGIDATERDPQWSELNRG